MDTDQNKTYFFLIMVFVCTSFLCVRAQNTSSAEIISKRIVEITLPDKDIPDDQLALYDERRRIEQEIEKYQQQIIELVPLHKELAKIDSLKKRASNIINEINQMNCNSVDMSKSEKLEARLSSVRSSLNMKEFEYDISEENPSISF